MMNELIEVLELSIKKNGSVPLTTQHLLNILKMAERRSERKEHYRDMSYPLPGDWE